MAHFDPSLIAARVLRQCLARSERIGAARALDYRKAWRKAGADLRKRPAPKKLLGPRVLHKKLSPERLAQIGDLDGLLPD